MPRPNRKLAAKIEADVLAAKQRAAAAYPNDSRSSNAHLVGGLYSVLAHAIAELRMGTYHPTEIDRLCDAFQGEENRRLLEAPGFDLTDAERDARAGDR